MHLSSVSASTDISSTPAFQKLKSLWSSDNYVSEPSACLDTWKETAEASKKKQENCAETNVSPLIRGIQGCSRAIMER